MARCIGWEKRLLQVVEDYRARPFAWGASDCLMFAGACIEAVTGLDPTTIYRGQYEDAAGAVRLLAALKFDNAVGAIAAHFAQIPRAHAGRGDIVVVTEPSSDDPMGAVGVLLGSMIAAYGAKGLHFLPPREAIRAFRVE